ncbi:tyrosine-type recombinase/integrase [Pseudomonas sp. F1_0610]|uniref:phage integrase n=1 Tax=Pseudomonas sp. F1_0610 TaxID=3114284 RepID=UPI0039C4DAA9
MAKKDLPPRMLKRVRTLKSGKRWIGYYYDGRDEFGKRKEYPLGTDLAEARLKWAEMEGIKIEPNIKTMGFIFDRYEREIIPTKKPRTQKDNLAELKQLRKVLDTAPIDAITPHVIAQYRDARTAKTRGNREIALLSHVFNIAREWGYTEKENPCTGVRRNKEVARDFYARQEVWDAVYEAAVAELKQAMLLAYLTGQRPADVLKFRVSDATEEYLLLSQNKTSKKIRIKLFNNNGTPSQLAQLLREIKVQRKLTQSEFLLCNNEGLRLSQHMLRYRWDEARSKAANTAKKNKLFELAHEIEQFQFRDIRPKAASEIEDLTEASKLLGHSNEQITQTVYRRVGEVVSPTK